ncbi:unnamed protein product [Ambrosiozyma monospora]|uniref:Unnamed protein product n=1 Tax=Ambrosiozyma monospora TaxID=43982 RepID=A0A9W7DFP4_AMBMO|nr:unnamed protein product [Ambrosiozyma monospora]
MASSNISDIPKTELPPIKNLFPPISPSSSPVEKTVSSNRGSATSTSSGSLAQNDSSSSRTPSFTLAQAATNSSVTSTSSSSQQKSFSQSRSNMYTTGTRRTSTSSSGQQSSPNLQYQKQQQQQQGVSMYTDVGFELDKLTRITLNIDNTLRSTNSLSCVPWEALKSGREQLKLIGETYINWFKFKESEDNASSDDCRRLSMSGNNSGILPQQQVNLPSDTSSSLSLDQHQGQASHQHSVTYPQMTHQGQGQSQLFQFDGVSANNNGGVVPLPAAKSANIEEQAARTLTSLTEPTKRKSSSVVLVKEEQIDSSSMVYPTAGSPPISPKSVIVPGSLGSGLNGLNSVSNGSSNKKLKLSPRNTNNNNAKSVMSGAVNLNCYDNNGLMSSSSTTTNDQNLSAATNGSSINMVGNSLLSGLGLMSNVPQSLASYTNLQQPQQQQQPGMMGHQHSASFGAPLASYQIHQVPTSYADQLGVAAMHNSNAGLPNYVGPSMLFDNECLHCQSKETPEWRRGPDGERTLCNACGLFYAKLCKKYGDFKAKEIMTDRKMRGSETDRRVSIG